MDELLVWQFLPKDGRLGKPLPDGSRPRITPGWTFRTDNPAEMRHRRLHGWTRATDAFRFARGFVVCRARIGGDICSERFVVDDRQLRGGEPAYLTGKTYYGNVLTVLWTRDARRILYHFACDLAEDALQRSQDGGWVPDPGLWEMIAAKRRWIAGDRKRWNFSPSASHTLQERIRIPLTPYSERLNWRIIWAVSRTWTFEPQYSMPRFIYSMIANAKAVTSAQQVNAELEQRLTAASTSAT